MMLCWVVKSKKLVCGESVLENDKLTGRALIVNHDILSLFWVIVVLVLFLDDCLCFFLVSEFHITGAIEGKSLIR